jgi:uncharacterized protein
MQLINRYLQDIINPWLFRNKIIIIYGARQVGKTTMVKELLKRFPGRSQYLNCETFSVKQSLESTDPKALKSIIGNTELLILDEAQRVHDIGLILKIIHDTYPEIQIIATGSSSFDLSNKVNEPLTGRALEFILYPFSLDELRQAYPDHELMNNPDQFIRFGLYPEIAGRPDSEARFLLDNLTGKYLYKDIFEFEQLKKPQLIVRLLQMVALQIGSEVSTNELAVALQVNRATVNRYLDLLEKSFVIFRLQAFSRNIRNELTKKFKVYFYDLGIRNSLISNFNSPEIRKDYGSLWENFFITERFKFLQQSSLNPNRYFWRTHNKAEIDYIEESDGKLSAFECKTRDTGKTKIPQDFENAYPGSTFQVISPENYWEFVTKIND